MPYRKLISTVLATFCLAIPATAGPATAKARWILTLRPGTDAIAFVQEHHLAGAQPCPRLGVVICPAATARRVRRLPAVAAAEPDAPLTQARRRITPATVRLGVRPQRVRAAGPIGILDGGIQDRPDLRVVYRLGDGAVADGHGTALAMLAAGPTGSAPGAPVWDLQAWGAAETPRVSHALRLIDQLLEMPHRPPVVLCAWTAPAPQRALTLALRALTAAGSLVVAAAGNQGEPVAGSLPAALPEVLTVSAYDNTTGTPGDDRGYAPWSNWGPAVDLTAPGLALYTWTGSHWGSLDGTSGAAALVAGLAARMAATPGGPAQWHDALVRQARPPLGAPDDRHPEPMAAWQENQAIVPAWTEDPSSPIVNP